MRGYIQQSECSNQFVQDQKDRRAKHAFVSYGQLSPNPL